MVASACGSILKRIFQLFAHAARLTSLHMPGGYRCLPLVIGGMAPGDGAPSFT